MRTGTRTRYRRCDFGRPTAACERTIGCRAFRLPMATQDLLDIWEYIATTTRCPRAEQATHEIDRVCFALGGWPEYGKARDDVRDGLSIGLGLFRYVIFYRVTKQAIEIVRVLDERRDIEAIFDDA